MLSGRYPELFLTVYGLFGTGTGYNDVERPFEKTKKRTV